MRHIFDTTGDQYLITDTGLHSVQYIAENMTIDYQENKLGLTVRKCEDQIPHALAPSLPHVLPTSDQSKIYCRYEDEPVYTVKPITKIKLENDKDFPNKVFIASTPQKRIFLKDSEEFHYEKTMEKLEEYVMEENELRILQDTGETLPTDLALKVPDHKSLWRHANFVAAHGIDVTFHPNRLILFLGARQGSCFAKALFDGARFNIGNYLAKMSLRGIYTPSWPLTEMWIENIRETGILPEPTSPSRFVVIGAAITAQNTQKIPMYRIESASPINFPWIQV